jgi:hypothetical protein
MVEICVLTTGREKPLAGTAVIDHAGVKEFLASEADLLSKASSTIFLNHG